MEHAFPIILLAFGGLMLLYAGLTAVCGFELIPKNYSVKVRDKKKYARCFAALIAVLGWVPVIAGLCGLFFGNLTALIILIAGLVFAIWIGRYIMRNADD